MTDAPTYKGPTRVFSGMQPTNGLHLGNYLGAIRNWARMQDAMEEGSQCLFFLADLHAISMPHSPAELKSATLEMAVNDLRRTMQAQVLPGALAVPLIGTSGCVGVLAAEVSAAANTGATLPLARSLPRRTVTPPVASICRAHAPSRRTATGSPSIAPPGARGSWRRRPQRRRGTSSA